jgi:hypothetical protein
MADFDPDAYLKKVKQPAKPPAGDDETWTGSAIGAVKDVGRGMGKGVVGDVVGAGQLLDPIGQRVAPGTTAAIERAGEGVKDWATAPSASAAESIGRFGGEALPFMVGGPELAIGKGVARALPLSGKAAGAIGEFLGNTAVGGAAGAVQPTKEGESRLANTLTGAASAGLLSPRVAGSLAGMAGGAGAGLGFEEIVRRFGWAPVLGALGALGVGAGHFGLMGLARRAAQASRYPGKVIANQVPAGLAGAVGGSAAEGAQENYDANSRP